MTPAGPSAGVIARPADPRGFGDNAALSAKPRLRSEPASVPDRRIRGATDALELSSMVGRVLRSLVRRAGDGDLGALEVLAALAAEVDHALADAALVAHEGDGRYSWSEIAAALGVTRQAARQRFGAKRPGSQP